MIPEFGLLALIAALAVACVQSFVGMLALPLSWVQWLRWAKPLAGAQALLLTLSIGCLASAFLFDDFSVIYIAENSNSELPWIYKICAVWGAHEGSLLLWAWILSLWAGAVAYFSHSMDAAVRARVLGIMALISIGFIWFMLATSNPFARDMLQFPAQGRDLNPLLQDPGLVSHPPMLYMGYVGFAVAYAFAISALLSKRLDAAWARWCRPWTLLAWSFLTCGITLGSWWAYRELGWGGWWFWDPVENASLMPWLSGTALLHALIVTDKRDAFKSWTALLAIVTFSLSLIGTFLVRSGVLVSVHAFASDPSRGLFILKFLMVVIGGSLGLYAWRAAEIRARAPFTALSREGFILYNNLILVVAMATILLGTVYPIILDSLGVAKISVGPPYFNRLFVPLFSVLMLLLGLGPLCQWKQQSPSALLHRVKYHFAWALLLAISVPLLLTHQASLMALFSLFLSLWVFAACYQSMRQTMRYGQTVITKLKKLTLGQVGMHLAHVGVAICVIGVAMTSLYSVQQDVRMQPGEQLKFNHFTLRWLETTQVRGQNYQATRAKFIVLNDKQQRLGYIHPEKRQYDASRAPMTDADTFSTFFYDIYIALADPIAGQSWIVRVYYKPFVRWIWAGGFMMMLGGLLAALDKRYYRRSKARGSVAAVIEQPIGGHHL